VTPEYNFYVFKPTGQHEETLNTVLDQVVSWGTALQAVPQECRPGKLGKIREYHS
jgi:hypothetical protein